MKYVDDGGGRVKNAEKIVDIIIERSLCTFSWVIPFTKVFAVEWKELYLRFKRNFWWNYAN